MAEIDNKSVPVLYLHGRRQIFTVVDEITENNVLQEVNKALAIHMQNVMEIDYLYWYRRGVHPILNRQKEIRPEINNKIVVNNAATVVMFKNGYFLTKPVTYKSRREDESVANKVKKLNEFLYTSGKHEADNEVVDWFHTVGVGDLYIEPNFRYFHGASDTPINVYAVDPRSAFVVYSMRPGNAPVYGANMVIDGDNVLIDVITHDKVFRLSGSFSGMKVTDDPEIYTVASTLDDVEPNILGEIPIIEYQYNSSRMGAFESAIPLMDAIDLCESNRLDSIEQTVQNLMVLYNCELPDGETSNSVRDRGLIVLKSTNDNHADVKLMSETLDQQQTQTTLNDLYDQMLEKCGVPSSVRDRGSTSDNVGAVYLRSGWAMADTDARNTEDQFRQSNKRFDMVFTSILRQLGELDIKMSDFDIVFIRNDMNNLLVKTQAAINMKELGFAPEIAFEKSGLSNDPVNDVERSKEYIDMKWGNEPVVNAEGSFADFGNENNPDRSADDQQKDGEKNGTDSTVDAV